MTREHILFVTWDGPQVSYLESLFIPIFERLQEHCIQTSILQFAWGNETRAEAACRAAGLAYRRVDIWRRFGALGAAATAIAGRFAVRQAILDWNPTILMPRSLFAGLAVLASGARNEALILFDADGLTADERRESGCGAATYRALLAIERAAVRSSCHSLVRTEAAAQILAQRADVGREHFTVVANGRDPKLFKPADAPGRLRLRRELGVADDAILLVYAGSAGPQYRLGDVARLVAGLRSRYPKIQLLVLSGEHDAAKRALGDEGDRAIFRSITPAEVPAYLSAADAGISLRTESLAMRGVAPVKIGEYLLCGLLVIGTPGIGDTEAALDSGMMIDAGLQPTEIANWLAGRIANREGSAASARAIGLQNFSIDRSVQDYRAAVARCRQAAPGATTLSNNSTTRGAWDSSE